MRSRFLHFFQIFAISVLTVTLVGLTLLWWIGRPKPEPMLSISTEVLKPWTENQNRSSLFCPVHFSIPANSVIDSDCATEWDIFLTDGSYDGMLLQVFVDNSYHWHSSYDPFSIRVRSTQQGISYESLFYWSLRGFERDIRITSNDPSGTNKSVIRAHYHLPSKHLASLADRIVETLQFPPDPWPNNKIINSNQ